MQSIGNPQQQLHICTSPAVLYITQMSLADTDTPCQFLLTDLTDTAHKADITADILQAFFIVHLDTSTPTQMKILFRLIITFLKSRFYLLNFKKIVKTIFALIIARLYPPTRHTSRYIRRSLVIYCPYVLPAAEVTACSPLVKFFIKLQMLPIWHTFTCLYPKKGHKKKYRYQNGTWMT